MDHKLALELKNAGFPQHEGEAFTQRYEINDCYIPTLSELIEACGELKLIGKKGYWLATTYKMSLKSIQITGTTPEEAVARLWLELNKK